MPPQTDPIAVAAAVASAGPVPFEAHFTSSGSSVPGGEIESYSWNFGDGTTSTEANPTKTYQAAGTYRVSMSITGADGVVTEATTFTVTAYPPGDASSLVFFPRLSRTYGLITDKIGVWTCKVAGSAWPAFDPAETAAWAQAISDSYFDIASRGRYHAEFTPLGTFEIDPENYTQSDCLTQGKALTGSPYNSAMIVDTTSVGGGLGGPGYVYNTGDPASLSTPPSESSRGFVVGGGSYKNFPGPDVVVHEMGHTLSFPHSFLDPSYEYDNQVDVMSGRTSRYTCSVPGFTYPCEPQHTLAFNRWAAGWVDEDQVVVHTGGTDQVTLAGPEAVGTQLIVAPSATSSQALVTIEARPIGGLDKNLDKGGVAVHVEDQRENVCSVGYLGGCPGLWRRAGQAWGQPNTYDHVLMPGQSKTIYGLTITVGTPVGSSYPVTVTGAPNVPRNVLATRLNLLAPPETDGHGGIKIDKP